MLMHSGMSSCPVLTPNGIVGSAITRAPAADASFADSAAK